MKFFGFKKSDKLMHEAEIEDLRLAIEKAHMPAEVQEVALHELKKLSKIGQMTAEYSITLNYLEYLTSLPWDKTTEDNLDLARVETILHQDHYGLEDIKARILEYLAVRALRAKTRYRIMVADEEESIRRNLQEVLEKEGYTVVTATDGMEVLRLMESSEFDLILADLKMKGLDGLAFLEKAKATWPETEFIMMSRYAILDSAVEAIKKSAFHYLSRSLSDLGDRYEGSGEDKPKYSRI
ncbi:MAG: response regulator [Deltaproteobacteria bacterium]|nr:MAG: response regulator [Deltaproteobacteria bacterium]